MRRLILALSFLFAFTLDAAAIQIDMTDGFVQVTGPTTMRVNNVFSMGNYYWADLEWDSTSNTFQVTDAGPMNCTSMEGLWNLHYDWGCVGSPARVSIQFLANGTFITGDNNSGTWSQDGCTVDWVYTNDTHYWGVMEDNGLNMAGDMYGYWAGDGCWSADRSFCGGAGPGPGSGAGKAAIGSGGEKIDQGE